MYSGLKFSIITKFIPTNNLTLLVSAFSASVILDTFVILLSPDLFALVTGKELSLLADLKIFENFTRFNALIMAVILVLVSSVFRIYFYWLQIKAAEKTGLNITLFLNENILKFKNDLDTSYEESELISLPTARVTALVAEIILPYINLLASGISIATILIFITYFTGPLFLILNIILFAGYGSLILLNRSEIKKISEVLSAAQGKTINISKRSIASNKDIVLNNLQHKFLSASFEVFSGMRTAYSKYAFNASKAKLYIEPLLLLMVLIGAYVYASSSAPVTSATLVPIAIGAQRLIPLLQSCYRNITQIQGGTENERFVMNFISKCDFLNEGDKYVSKKRPSLNSENIIEIEKLKIMRGGKVINVIENFTVLIGDIVCITGESGVGKTSTLDTIAGYYDPKKNLRFGVHAIEKGTIYHSQNAPLIDGTVRENMTLFTGGLTMSDDDLYGLLKAVGLDRLAEMFILNPALKISESDGSFSGGQKQRLAFCRVLLANPGLYILDEPFSSLDDTTAVHLFQLLAGKNITTIIVSHQEAIQKMCSKSLIMHEYGGC